MSKTSHIQYLCRFARHGRPLYHSKFIVTIGPKGYNQIDKIYNTGKELIIIYHQEILKDIRLFT